MVKKSLALILLLSLVLSACQTFDLFSSGNNSTGNSSNSIPPANPVTGSGNNAVDNSGNNVNNPAPPEPTATKTLAPTATATATPTNTPTPVPQSYGPDSFPSGINPLTCLPVIDPASLAYPPALISIPNFPASARPQAGLSWANIVIEGYIGEGMNRFLTVFHGDFPSTPTEGSMTLPETGDAIGPIRSGRVWFEDWRQLFNGFIVAAGAAQQVLSQLGGFNYQFGSDESDINSALIPIDKLKEIAESSSRQLGEAALNSNLCEETAPDGGRDAQTLFTYYAPLNQALWQYEPSLGAYQRYENDTVTGETFTLMQDRINQKALQFENIIIVYTDFHGKDTYFYMDLMYNKGLAQILRDGKLYDIRWTTEAGDYEKTTGKNRPMRFTYANGDPFPLKPGQTWILLAPLGSQKTMHETLETGTYVQLLAGYNPGSGHWIITIFGPRAD